MLLDEYQTSARRSMSLVGASGGRDMADPKTCVTLLMQLWQDIVDC